MKKIITLFLASAMILSFASCGGKDDGNDTKSTTSVTKSTASVASETKKIETGLWTLDYDDTVWSYTEEDLTNEESEASVLLEIPDGEDSSLVSVEITVSITDAESFRGYLNSYGFDQYEYAVNNAYEFTKIGGIDCLKQEGNYWGDPCIRYFNRVEGAGATVFIEIVGETADARVDALLSGLTINLTDTGNVDFPWHWDGEPFSSEAHSATVGSHTLNSEWLPIEECIVTGETFNHDIAVAGDKAYILNDGKLFQYSFDGKKLTLDSEITLDGDYSCIQSTEDGSIWVSGHVKPLISMKDGIQTGSYDDTKYVAMHPSAKWGISWFSNPECEKITIADGTATASPITFAEVSMISNLIVDNDYIYICGSAADDSGHKVFVYDKDGKLQKTLADEDGSGLGSITFVAKTSNGFMALDGNMRSVIFWDKDGKYIGDVEDSELFGTNYPWFCSGTQLKDGSVIALLTEDRADKSAMELITFALKGF